MSPIHQRYKVLGVAIALSMMPVSFAQAQTCKSQIPLTTPTTDFEVHNNGTVTHTPTGLMWKVCSEGQEWQSDGRCTGVASKHNWQAALQIPQTLNTQGGFAGHADWRLPNVKELNSIKERACAEPAINTDVFNNMYTPDWPYAAIYWTASPMNSDSARSYCVSFVKGHFFDEHRSLNYRVRLVRGGR
ncbi:MAG: DUF1566 domain-containing protein [Thiomicrospira sp.]